MLFRQHGRSLTVHTPAKLNLFLEVLGKRSDGFHELETLMMSVRLYDTLCFTEDASGKICLDEMAADPHVGGDESFDVLSLGKDNLIIRAAELLQSYAGIESGVRIRLYKRIPVSAGLAGGSSNAAATLAALNRIWGLNLPVRELQKPASQLGSDVGFFLENSSTAVCRGRGEMIESLCVPVGMHFVIVRPQTGLSTAEVFQHCQPAGKTRNVNTMIDCLKRGRISQAARCMHNALQPPAEQMNPEVTQLRKLFDTESVLGHMMSGSGSAYFGMCATRRQACRIASRIQNTQIGMAYVAGNGP
ncbi:MAG: 4-(cytidine 5'-diphospho)-2-C-methyl-D-erythritol kinase [Planctomycetes bacterium]|nr:4-(cytidine 5'-diphospho)-2-C-methyl-D-erythritol kinase [Planctomycetota bacterium]